MILFATRDGRGLEESPSIEVYVAGAESNVAAGLAHLGHATEWFGRVGDDPFGVRIGNWLTQSGIAMQEVIVDSARPTGVYFKQRGARLRDVYYYRSGSAASALSAADYNRVAIRGRRLVHLSGITAALSPTADGLLQRAVVDRDQGGPLVSFDVNYRPSLWPVDVAGPRLLALARASDVVFVGRDEASVLWGTDDPPSVRSLLHGVPHLVVKDAEHGATYFGEVGARFVPSLTVDVIEPVGAGDAFAAGFLSGLLRGWEPSASLRLGHVMAAYSMQDVSDVPELPDPAEILLLAKVQGSQWSELNVVLPSRVFALSAHGEVPDGD
jgi:2-dehydro-3-deoxygluconokinase